MNIKPKREGDKIQKILERFDKRFFNPSIPSPTELKSFIQKELSSLIREEYKRGKKAQLKIDIRDNTNLVNVRVAGMVHDPSLENLEKK